MYRRNPQGWLKHIDFILLDLLCLQISYLLAYLVRYGAVNPYVSLQYRSMSMIMIMLSMVVAGLFETFREVLKRGWYREFVMTLRHVLLVELMVAFYLVTVQQSEMYSRFVLYLTGIFYAIIAYIVRCFWKKYIMKRKKSFENRKTLIVTTNDNAESVAADTAANVYQPLQIIGMAVTDADREGETIGGVKVLAQQSDVLEYVCREWIDEVLIDIPAPNAQELTEKFAEMGVIVHSKLTEEKALVGKKQFIERLGDSVVMTTSINCASTKQLIMKRILDIVGGIVGTLVTLLLCVIVGPIIKLKSPGPIFFKQERVGRNGKKFQMYKFRSMYMDAEERKKELQKDNRVKDGLMFKLDKDPRIIGSRLLPDGTYKKGIGNRLRDWSLDEFPQFINVLKGDMSLIGTRPPTVDEWEKYQLHHRARLAIKPGMAGMWQVSGRSGITDFEEVVRLDVQYISEWNIGLDIKIMIKTLKVLLKKEGAM